MVKVVLNGPSSYRAKGFVFTKDDPKKDVPTDVADYLMATGKFLYEGQKDPVKEAAAKNKEGRTRKMSDILGTNKKMTPVEEVQTEETKKTVTKKAVKKSGKKGKKVKKKAAIDKGVPVFDTVEELAEYAVEKHNILVSDDDYAGTLKQIVDELERREKAEQEAAEAKAVQV